jgi:hypothetical protein
MPEKTSPPCFQTFAIGRVDFVAVAVAFADRGRTIDRRDMAVAVEPGFIGAQTHRAAQIAAFLHGFRALRRHPFGDDADHRLVGRAKFGRTGIGDPGGVARAFDAGHLHAEADAEEGYLAFAGKADRRDLPFGAALARSAGHENAVHRFEMRGDLAVVLFEQFGVDPA